MSDPPGVEPIHWVNDAILDAGEAVDKVAERVRKMVAVDKVAERVRKMVAGSEPSDLEDVVKAALNLRAVMAQARDAQAALLAYAYDLMPQRQVVFDGIGPVGKTGGWKRKDWEHEALLAKVVRWAKEDRERYAREHAGEAPAESEGEAVARLLREYAHVDYWKLEPIRAQRGLDPDDYCRKEPAPKSISLPKQE